MSAADLVDHPIIRISGQGDLSTVCDEIVHLLDKFEAPIYQRGGMLVRVVEEQARPASKGIVRDPAAPRIVPLDDLALVDIATQHLQIMLLNRKSSTWTQADLPRLYAQTILARKEWPFRRLEAVVVHPVMLPTGDVLWESGYHEASGLLLRLPFAGFESPIHRPSHGELLSALDELLDLLSGFEFYEAVDESVALAFLLTPFVRPLIPTAPMFAVDAHAPGSGKSTLVRIESRLSAGTEPAFITLGADPVEMRKVLFAALLEGDQHIAIDNVEGPVGGADLAVMLTSPVYRGRVLGQSQNVSVPTKAVMSINGNNLQVVGDLTRRVLICRLDPSAERPAERHFRFDPVKEASEGRSTYVNAALTIMSAYIASGERVSVRPFGSFEEWSRLVREPLIWLGLPDPVDSIRVLEAADPERAQLATMLQAVHAAFGRSEFKARALTQTVKAKGQQAIAGQPALTDPQVSALTEALQTVCERNGELNEKALGRWLQRVNGRIDGGLRFALARRADGVAIWQVQAAG
jgi:hypothetical protein